MILRMARPIKLKDSADAYFRKRIPAGVQRPLAGLPKTCRPPGWGREAVKVSLRAHASDSAAVTAEQARIAAEVSARIAELRRAFAG